MGKGLFKSIYGKIDEGIFKEFYPKEGSDSPVKSMDIRSGLGNLGQEDEDERPGSPSPALPSLQKKPFFSQEFMGFPNWLIGIFILGFAYAYRSKKKASS